MNNYEIESMFRSIISDLIDKVYYLGYNEGHADGYMEGHKDGMKEAVTQITE